MVRAIPGDLSPARLRCDQRTYDPRGVALGERQWEDLYGHRPCRSLRHATNDRGLVVRLSREGCREFEIAWLRQRLGELVASQAVEEMPEGFAHTLVSQGRGDALYHAYNAALKRATGGKARSEITLAKLEAALEWLGRSRPRDHLHPLLGDHHFGWQARSKVSGNR